MVNLKVSNPMTLTEKIISKACERSHVVPNDNVWVKTDVLMTHDVCGPGTIGNFYKEFGHNAKVSMLQRKASCYGACIANCEVVLIVSTPLHSSVNSQGEIIWNGCIRLRTKLNDA